MVDLAISIEKLHKSIAGKDILEHINLTQNAGEYIGLVGVNGAGKTTLIKCLLDFCDVTSGTINIFGIAHTHKLSRANLAFMPELFIPPYYLTGKHFLQYMAKLHGVEYDPRQVETLADALDLKISALSKPVREFSKGMSQKLGLLACLASNKDLMIFDEPMSGLDVKARAQLKQYLMYLKEAGMTIFLSTHLLADVELLCDRIAILHNGHICFNGTPQACIEMFSADTLEQAYLNCVQ